MSKVEKLEIFLSPEIAAAVEEAVSGGEYESASHVISRSPNVIAWSSSTRPCLYSSRTARKRTMTSRRSVTYSVRRRNVMRPARGSSSPIH